MLYGSECWAVNKKMVSRMRTLRCMCNDVTRGDRIRDSYINGGVIKVLRELREFEIIVWEMSIVCIYSQIPITFVLYKLFIKIVIQLFIVEQIPRKINRVELFFYIVIRKKIE